MSNLAEEFSKVDKENHSRMQGAIKSALLADFKVEEKPKRRQENGFSKKPIEFFVREKIDPATFNRPKKQLVEAAEVIEDPEGADSSVEAEFDKPASEATSQEAAAPQETPEDLDELSEVLANDGSKPDGLDAAPEDVDALSPEDDAAQTEHYEEGFAAGRAAALSELEEQRIENLEVLKSISEKLLTDSCFDFDNISTKVLDTVNELSSERCGIEIDENPEGFLKRIEQQIDQVRNLSKDRWLFFNELDLESLRTFEEFENFFSDAKVRSDPMLKRGDVIVKVGGVELRDAPFSDYEEGS
jgi:flagellar biosynthesis/type III secretory pathway protein FliH